MTFGHDAQRHRMAHEQNIRKKEAGLYVLIRLFQKNIRKPNVPIIIHLIVNVFIIAGTVSFLFELPIYFSFPAGTVPYFFCRQVPHV